MSAPLFNKPALLLRMKQLLLVAFLLSWGISSYAHAQEQPALNVVTIPLPPWGYYSEDRSPKGITYEWANAIAKRMGRKINNRIVPMARLFKSLEYGKADFSIMLRTPYSEKVTTPVVDVGIPFRTIIWPRKGLKLKSYKDLKGLTLSMARGLKVGGQFANHKNLKIVPSMDYNHSMLMFKAGRVDAVVGTQQSLIYNAFKIGLMPREDFDSPFEVDRLQGWVQASHDYVKREGLDSLKKAAESLIKDGTFEKIYKKYQTSLTAYQYSMSGS